MGSCSANIRELGDQSAIKGNLSKKNAFLWPNKALWRISYLRPSWSLILGEQKHKKRGEEKK